jgi:hypothetical protein
MVDFPIEAVEIKKKLKVLKSFGENVCSHGHAQSMYLFRISPTTVMNDDVHVLIK